VGFSKTCYDKDEGRALIAVDMGGMLFTEHASG